MPIYGESNEMNGKPETGTHVADLWGPLEVGIPTPIHTSLAKLPKSPDGQLRAKPNQRPQTAQRPKLTLSRSHHRRQPHPAPSSAAVCAVSVGQCAQPTTGQSSSFAHAPSIVPALVSRPAIPGTKVRTQGTGDSAGRESGRTEAAESGVQG